MFQFIDIAYASEVSAEEVAHEAVEGGVLSSLGINGQLFIFQLINFAIVAVILWFLILKPLLKKMGERQKMIDDSLDNAKKVQDNLTRSERDYQSRIDDAKVAANKILEQASSEAEKVADGMKEKAKKEIELVVEQAKRNIRIEKDEMIRGLKTDTASLIVAAVEKIINEKLDERKDKVLIDEVVKKLK